MPRTAPTTTLVCQNPACDHLVTHAADDLEQALTGAARDPDAHAAVLAVLMQAREVQRRRDHLARSVSVARDVDVVNAEHALTDDLLAMLRALGLDDVDLRPLEVEATMTMPTMWEPSEVVGDPSCPSCGEDL